MDVWKSIYIFTSQYCSYIAGRYDDDDDDDDDYEDGSLEEYDNSNLIDTGNTEMKDTIV